MTRICTIAIVATAMVLPATSFAEESFTVYGGRTAGAPWTLWGALGGSGHHAHGQAEIGGTLYANRIAALDLRIAAGGLYVPTQSNVGLSESEAAVSVMFPVRFRLYASPRFGLGLGLNFGFFIRVPQQGNRAWTRLDLRLPMDIRVHRRVTLITGLDVELDMPMPSAGTFGIGARAFIPLGVEVALNDRLLLVIRTRAGLGLMNPFEVFPDFQPFVVYDGTVGLAVRFGGGGRESEAAQPRRADNP